MVKLRGPLSRVLLGCFVCLQGDAQKLRHCLASLAFYIKPLAGQHLHAPKTSLSYLVQIFLLLQSTTDATGPRIRVTPYPIRERSLRDNIRDCEPSAG